MTSMTAPIGRCAIYHTRPVFCRDFPTAADWRPLSCTYTFDAAGERGGDCDASVCGAENCCQFPRVSGEPLGAFDPKKGLPCRELRGLEEHPHPDRGSRIYAQVDAHGLWVGEVLIRRETEGLWSIARVVNGQQLWHVHVQDATLRGLVERDKGALDIQVPRPGFRTLRVRLRREHVEALWRLHPMRLSV